MMMVDPFSVLAACVQLAAIGFSPLGIPIAVFLHWGFREEWWGSFAANFSSWEVTAYCLPAIAVVCYWLNGLFLLLVDMQVRPEVLKEFKLQPGKRFDQTKLPAVFKNILIGQVFVIVPYAYCCAQLGKYTPFAIQMTDALPSGRRVFFDTVGFILFDELVFFYSHWALHSKLFGVNWYSRVHKIHHEFTAPVGLVASYCHPLEMLISNALPLTFGAALMRAHAFSIMTWVVFAVLGTQFHHCGYRWPWVAHPDHNPDFHDFHHQKFNSNFGLLGILDKLHGTDKLWVEAQKKAGRRPLHPLSGAISSGMVVAFLGSLASQMAVA